MTSSIKINFSNFVHTCIVSLLILLTFVLLSKCFLRFQLESWYVYSIDCMIYWVHISLESGHCDLLCTHSLGTGNYQSIHWFWHTGVLGSLWLLLLANSEGNFVLLTYIKLTKHSLVLAYRPIRQSLTALVGKFRGKFCIVNLYKAFVFSIYSAFKYQSSFQASLYASQILVYKELTLLVLKLE